MRSGLWAVGCCPHGGVLHIGTMGCGLAGTLPGAGLGIAGLSSRLPGAGLGIGPGGPIGLLHVSWSNKNQVQTSADSAIPKKVVQTCPWPQ